MFTVNNRRHKAQDPKTTLVVHVSTMDIPRYRQYLKLYAHSTEIPPELSDLLKAVYDQLPEEA